MNRRIRIISLLLIAMTLMLSGCASFKKIRPVSAKVESVMPSGLKSVVLNLAVEIDNPAPEMALSDIEGVVSRSGKVLGRVVLDPFILEAKTLEKYHLRATITLDQGASLFDVMSLVNQKALDECFVDVYFKATYKKCVSKKMSYENLPLRSLMKM